MDTKSTSLQSGHTAERRAEHHLRSMGLEVLTRNYRCRGGELDLVMREGDEVVFVEVRQRRSLAFGGALESVDAAKCRRLRLAAAHWLQRHSVGLDQPPCRFDLVAIEPGDQGPFSLHWIRHVID